MKKLNINPAVGVCILGALFLLWFTWIQATALGASENARYLILIVESVVFFACFKVLFSKST